MAETLGTRDVLEQIDIRLGNVEQGIRSLRTEMNSRFDWVYQEMSGLRAEIRWLYDLLVAVLLGVAGLWFK